MICPSALSPRETDALQRWARARRCVEAGALLGYSTIHMAQVASGVVSIDRHEGYSGPTWKPYLSNLERAGVRHRVLPVKGDVFDALPHVDGDFGFIDLTGTYDVTRKALSLMRAHFVGVHDATRSRCEGVGQALRDYITLEHVDTLVIAVKP
jgi:hypothetical protein